MPLRRMQYQYIGLLLSGFILVSYTEAQVIILPSNSSVAVSIREDVTVQSKLAEIIDTGCPSCMCSMGNNMKDPFGIWKTSQNYEISYLGEHVGSLNYKILRTYQLKISCKDRHSLTQYNIELHVDVVPNEAPVVKKSDYIHVEVPKPNGDNVFHVIARDPESDTLKYTFKTPSVSFLKINATTGKIYIAATDELYRAANRSVLLQVEVTDGRSTVNLDLTVDITNLYTPPDILGLPAIVYIPENKAGFIITYTATYWNNSKSTTKPTCIVNPIEHSNKFSFLGSGSTVQITLDTVLDYETMPILYKIRCETSDEFMSSGLKELTVIVLNVNEPPVFEDQIFYCELDESQENAGPSSCSLGTDKFLQDPEGDTITSVDIVRKSNINDVSHKFRFIKSTRTLFLDSEYDVDDTSANSVVQLLLQAKDVHGEASTATVHVFIRDINDKTCTFPPMQPITIKTNEVPRYLPQLQAPDGDRTSPNNLVTYSFVRAEPPESKNHLALYPDGSIFYLGQIPESDKRQIFSFVFRCEDGGIPRRSSETTVILTNEQLVTSTSTTTTTTTTTIPPPTTTTESSDVWDDSTFVGVFAGLMCLLLLGLLLGVVLCCWYCGHSESGLTICLKEFLCPKPKPQKVLPEDDNMVFSIRTNPDYKDEYWKQGDSFETGKEKEKNDPLAGAPVLYPKPGTSTSFKF